MHHYRAAVVCLLMWLAGCGYRDGPMMGRPITITQIQQALGDILSFEFAATVP